MLLFYLIVGLGTAKSLYHWSQHFAASEISQHVRDWTQTVWAVSAAIGAETPQLAVETWFLRLQDVRPGLYPLNYADTMARANTTPPTKTATPLLTTIADDPVRDMPGKVHGPRVLVAGDSIMLTVGPALKHAVESRLSGAAIVNAKLSTGLARPDVYDWVGELRRIGARQHFDYTVIMLGTNDSQDFYESGMLIAYGTPEWVRIYNQRLNALMDAVCDGASHGVWLGMPPMRNVAFARKILRINSWAQQRVREHRCMQFVATDHILGDELGGYAPYLTLGRHLEKVRMGDGIHVTKSGGTLLSFALMSFLHAKTATDVLAH